MKAKPGAPIVLVKRIEAFLAHERRDGKAEVTLRNYRTDLTGLQRVVGDVVSSLHLKRAIPRHLDQLQVAQHSWNRHLSTLRRFCDYLVADGVLCENPLASRCQMRVEWTAPKHIHADQARDLMRRIERPRDRALVAILWQCGLRIGEALDLRASNVDLRYGVLRVGVSKREVRLSPRAKLALMEHLRISNVPADDFLFLANGGRRLSYAGAHRLFRRYAGQSGLTMRQLRAAAAASALDAGVRLKRVQNMLGHLHSASTVRYHHSDEPRD